MARINRFQMEAGLRTGNLSSLVNQLVADDDPWLFRQSPETYKKFSDFLRGRLPDPNAMCLVVGSAKFGFSPAPDTFGREFRSVSDIDVAVISPVIFDEIWSRLLAWRYPWHTRKWAQVDQAWAIEHLENHYQGWIDPERMRVISLSGDKIPPPIKDITNQWFDAFKLAANIGPARGHDVEGRLYRTQAHLEKYLRWGLETVRRQLPRSI